MVLRPNQHPADSLSWSLSIQRATQGARMQCIESNGIAIRCGDTFAAQWFHEKKNQQLHSGSSWINVDKLVGQQKDDHLGHGQENRDDIAVSGNRKPIVVASRNRDSEWEKSSGSIKIYEDSSSPPLLAHVGLVENCGISDLWANPWRNTLDVLWQWIITELSWL